MLETERFSDVFRGYRNGTLGKNGLIIPFCGWISVVTNDIS